MTITNNNEKNESPVTLADLVIAEHLLSRRKSGNNLLEGELKEPSENEVTTPIRRAMGLTGERFEITDQDVEEITTARAWLQENNQPIQNQASDPNAEQLESTDARYNDAELENVDLESEDEAPQDKVTKEYSYAANLFVAINEDFFNRNFDPTYGLNFDNIGRENLFHQIAHFGYCG